MKDTPLLETVENAILTFLLKETLFLEVLFSHHSSVFSG
ncbi:hypothetical protein RV11_GL002703 [Enterococcus phoeniculicola]|nr:hypothetical protein RV11_GL002703 [Enterococcus phoeniculicola]